MVELLFDKNFAKIFSKIKDKQLRTKIKKQIQKTLTNPNVGKPMRNARKGTRELYIPPFRLSYIHKIKENKIYILDLYHKKKQ